MKIDFSKWIIIPQSDGYGLSIENPTEGLRIYASVAPMPDDLSTFTDPMKLLKELAKREITRYYLGVTVTYNQGKTISVEDNLDYVENEAERRGLI